MHHLAVAAAATTVAAQVDAEGDVEELQQSAVGAWETFVAALPRVGIALLALVAFVLFGRLIRSPVRRRLERRRTPSFARVFGRLAGAAATVVGVLVAMAIAFPSVRPVDLLAGAGVLSVAAGFAFQDILQNLLAGVLLLFREPFRGGDQIQVGDVQGTVDEINIRETVITTFDGRRVLIPNSRVYTDVIRVQTAHPRIRSDFTVGIGHGCDPAVARAVGVAALGRVDGVAADPPPEALVRELSASTVDLEMWFWTSPRQRDVRRTRGAAIEAVKAAFDRQGIEMPSGIVALESTPSLQAALHPPSAASEG
jgi:small-conductance mechanosensitive channel